MEVVKVPFWEDVDGARRIGKSRVLLEIVVHAHQDLATPEEIADGYDTITLAEIRAVIAYYQAHRQDVEDYLARRERLAVERAAATVWRLTEQQRQDLFSLSKRIRYRAQQEKKRRTR